MLLCFATAGGLGALLAVAAGEVADAEDVLDGAGAGAEEEREAGSGTGLGVGTGVVADGVVAAGPVVVLPLAHAPLSLRLVVYISGVAIFLFLVVVLVVSFRLTANATYQTFVKGGVYAIV